MKLGQILLIIFTSIITLIGLAFSKLYDKYVKNNAIVQMAFYLFWTLLIFRGLYWVAKPFLHINVTETLHNLGFEGISIQIGDLSAYIVCLIFLVGITGSCIWHSNKLKYLEQTFKENK